MFIYLTIDFTSIQLVTSRLPGFETHSEYKAVWQLQTSTQNVPFIQMNRPNKQGLRIDFHDIIITIGQKKLHLLLKSDTNGPFTCKLHHHDEDRTNKEAFHLSSSYYNGVRVRILIYFKSKHRSFRNVI